MAKAQRISKGDLRDGFKLGVMDLETTGLDADFGRILCGTVKTLGGTSKTFRIDKTSTYKKEPWNDVELAVALRNELNKFHGVVGYNSLNFDWPMLNTRLLTAGYEPINPSVQVIDPIWVVRSRMKLGRNTLDRLLSVLKCDEQKLHVGPEVWQRAGAGSKKDLDLIVKRNVSDVVALEQAFNKIVALMPLKFSFVR